MIKTIGKCLLIEEGRERVLVVGDIHIGYGREGEAYGAIVNKGLFDEMIGDFGKIFAETGKVNKVILLGDLKHSFSGLERGERNDLINLFDFLDRNCEEILVIRGNHDNYLLGIASAKGITVYDYYFWQDYCFLHGDKDFKEIHEEGIRYWVMGHLHPAIKLSEGNKTEKFKCFLFGRYRKKKIIILPSFVEAGEGIDAREIEKEMAWDLKLGEFDVFIASTEAGEGLDFGKLKRIK